MKKTYTPITRFLTASVMLFLVSAMVLIGQTPSTFNYQAVLRDTDGNPRTNVSVSIELDIHQSTATGSIVYSETHSTSTNGFGLVNLEMGSLNLASFESIDWSAGPYFVEVSVDGTSMGTSQLLTVPYALHANTTENYTETDPVYTGSQAANITAGDITNLGNLTGINTGDQDGSETHVNAGTNVTVSGTGTSGSPYVVSASGIISYSISSATSRTIASTLTSAGHEVQLLQISGVPAGTYAVFFSCPIGKTSTSSLGINLAWAIETNSGNPSFPSGGVATSFIPATGWTSNYIFGQSGFKIVTLGSTGTIDLVGTYYGNLLSGAVTTRGTVYMRAIRL